MRNEGEALWVRLVRKSQRFYWPSGMAHPVRLLLVWLGGLAVLLPVGWVLGSVGISDALSPGQGGTTGVVAAAFGWTLLVVLRGKVMTE